VNIAKNRIESSLSECEKHLNRLRKISAKLSPFFPLSAESLENLSDETVTGLDQFLFRFMKLQDAMGTKLFPVLAGIISGSDDPRPFIDTLNILEKHHIIRSSEEWQNLRVARNTVAHEYPDSADQTVEALNLLLSDWTVLERMFVELKDYYWKNLSSRI
jgi:hypothetical protein